MRRQTSLVKRTLTMRLTLLTASFFALLASQSTAPAAAHQAVEHEAAAKPTIVLVHGVFAGSSSWNGVIANLKLDHYRVIAVANPLRSVKSDAEYVAALFAEMKGPVVLVGHSYGGEVISVAAADRPNVTALVFLAGYAPEMGESGVSLSSKFPTGTLTETVAPPVKLPDGTSDLYIEQGHFGQQFAADVPEVDALGMAMTQRHVTLEALGEPVKALSWQKVPSSFVWRSLERNIPTTLHPYMAKSAKARAAVEIPGASYVVMISHPREVAEMVERAAEAR